MSRAWDNPVARLTLRRGRRSWLLAVPLLLLGCAVLAGVLQHYWMELEFYSLLRPAALSRWTAFLLLDETVVAAPWAAARGALLWKRLQGEHHLEEYRRSRLSAGQITLGVLAGAVTPVLLLLAASFVVTLAAALLTGGLAPQAAIGTHLLLLMQVLAFGALGLWLAGQLRYPGLAVPLSLAVLAAAVTLIGALEPFYGTLSAPERWIYALLLPNPVTAVGVLLETDVLRFSWIYEHISANEYPFVYPPAWQTGGLYLLSAGALLARVSRRIGDLS